MTCSRRVALGETHNYLCYLFTRCWRRFVGSKNLERHARRRANTLTSVCLRALHFSHLWSQERVVGYCC